MADDSAVIERLLESECLRGPVFRSAIRALELPQGSRGLDAGCGIGLQALLLADAVGSRGHVTGVDVATGLLAYGEELAKERGYADVLTLREADVRSLPFEDDTFDWVWSADCVGYPAGELTPVLDELRRVTKPGGRVVLLAWSSQQLLPGYPLLEARLNATCSSYAPFLRDTSPESHVLRALRWFREVGLREVGARTFVGDVHSPLGEDERAALASLFGMLWGEPAAEASPGDLAELRRLCRPDSPDFIVDQPGYYAFFTYSVFRGTVPER